MLHQLDQPLDGVNNLGAKHSAMNVALGAKAQPLLTSKHARSFYDTPFPITSADSPGSSYSKLIKTQVRAAAVVFYLLGKLQVEGVMRDL